MQILLFARDGVGDHIRDAIMRTVPETEVCNAVRGLVGKIMNSSGEPVVAVLMAGSRSELEEIRVMKWLLRDICTVLILPDQDADTVAAGFELHPRFMGCLDDDADGIAAVLCKMLTRARGDAAKRHDMVPPGAEHRHGEGRHGTNGEGV